MLIIDEKDIEKIDTSKFQIRKEYDLDTGKLDSVYIWSGYGVNTNAIVFKKEKKKLLFKRRFGYLCLDNSYSYMVDFDALYRLIELGIVKE